MNRARMLITPELLQDVLCLPIDAKIVAASWDDDRRCVVLLVTHPDFPTAAIGSEPPFAAPIFRARKSAEFVDWGVIP